MKRASDLSRKTLEKIVDDLQQHLFLNFDTVSGHIVFDPAKTALSPETSHEDFLALLNETAPALVPLMKCRFQTLEHNSEPTTVVIEVQDNFVRQVVSDGDLRVVIVDRDVPEEQWHGVGKVLGQRCLLNPVINAQVNSKDVQQALGDMLVSEHLVQRAVGE